MAGYDFDLFTIGAGSGGVRASRMSSQLGARVAVAEEQFLGGTCVNVGCVPKKLLSYAAHFADDFEDAGGFGWTVGPRSHDWKTLIANKNKEIQRLNDVYRSLLGNAGVTLIEGRAKLLDEHTVEVNGETYTARRILVATGGRPSLPSEPGAEFGITSEEAFFLEELPKRVLVAGGGYIAVEFAGIFNGLGAQVTQLYRKSLFLRGFDTDARRFLADEMRKKGIDLRFETIIDKTEKQADGSLLCHLSDGSQIEVDCVFYAIGRHPNTTGIGLEDAGVDLDRHGAIVVDDDYRTSTPNIFALGDVTNRVNLTPVAIAEGMYVAHTLFGDGRLPVDYSDIPTAIFSNPTMANVGLTEAQARKRYGGVDVYVADFRPMKHTLSGSDERTFMKLLVDPGTDRVVGCHMVGLDAPEIIQGLGIALKCGATKAQFDATIGIHPTAAEEFVTMREPRAPQQAAAAE